MVKDIDRVYVTHSSDKSKKTAMILCALCFIGLGGLHDFYVGNFGKGFLKLCTVNFFIFGGIFDIIKLANGTYTDGAGQPLKK